MGKGGGGGSTPSLVDDNLKNKQFLNIIDLVSEGPIEGPVGGMQGFLLNGTPIVDKQGNPKMQLKFHGLTRITAGRKRGSLYRMMVRS